MKKTTQSSNPTRLKARLTFCTLDTILCPMKAAIYLAHPAAMRKARLNQPRVNSEQARRQRQLLQRVSEKFSRYVTLWLPSEPQRSQLRLHFF